MNQAFAQYGWCACIRGVESGGLVEGLPVHNFRTDSGDVAMKCPTETPITDRREKELADLGFAPLVHRKGTPNAASSACSRRRSQGLHKDAATANARISAQLPYIFAVSRFAHYLKAMMRDKIGGYMSRSESADVPQHLDRELRGGQRRCAAVGQGEASAQGGAVDVQEVPGKPGVYRAIAFLRPHFQLDELSVSMRLVAELPAPAK